MTPSPASAAGAAYEGVADTPGVGQFARSGVANLAKMRTAAGTAHRCLDQPTEEGGAMQLTLRRLLKVCALASNRCYWRAAAIGVAAGIENEPFLRTQRFNTLIDVGANKGQFALVARAQHPRARILSFEPVGAAVAKFEAVFSDDSRTEIFQCAVGSEVGTASIRIPPNNGGATFVVPLHDVVRTETVSVTTLDHVLGSRVLDRPILLKLDVQGFEMEALKGAEAVLPQIDDLYVEVTFRSLAPRHPAAHEIILWLHERGFEVAGVYNPISGGTESFGADIHFKRTGSPGLKGSA